MYKTYRKYWYPITKILCLTLAAPFGCTSDDTGPADTDMGSSGPGEATTDGQPSSAGSSGDTAGTSGSSDSGAGEVEVRLFHAAIRSDGDPDAGFGAGAAIELDLDIYLDGDAEPAVAGLSLAEASDRVSMTPGEHLVEARLAGSADPLYSTAIDVGASGGATLVFYNAAADFSSETVELSVQPVYEGELEAAGGGAAFVGVHLDGNSRSDVFQTYAAPFDLGDQEPLGLEFGYEQTTGVYAVSDLSNSHLDADSGIYDGGFSCATSGVGEGEGYIIVWGTNSVAAPGTTAGSSNAYVLGPDTSGLLAAMPCVPQGQSDQETPTVRVFNAAIQSDGDPETGFGAGTALPLDVDLYFDGGNRPAVSGLALGEASERLELLGGDHLLEVRSSETGEVLLTENLSTTDTPSTLVLYNTAPDFVAGLELASWLAEEVPQAEDGTTSFLAVHLDANSRSDAFRAYNTSFDDVDAIALGAEFSYEAESGSYTTRELSTAYLDADAGDYEGGFACTAGRAPQRGPHLIVWGTNSVALPGRSAGSSNAYLLGPASVGVQEPLACIPQ